MTTADPTVDGPFAWAAKVMAMLLSSMHSSIRDQAIGMIDTCEDMTALQALREMMRDTSFEGADYYERAIALQISILVDPIGPLDPKRVWNRARGMKGVYLSRYNPDGGGTHGELAALIKALCLEFNEWLATALANVDGQILENAATHLMTLAGTRGAALEYKPSDARRCGASFEADANGMSSTHYCGLQAGHVGQHVSLPWPTNAESPTHIDIAPPKDPPP